MKKEPNQDLARIQKEAAQWLARLNSEEADYQQRRQFRRWIAQSPVHRQEFFKMREIMAGIEGALANSPKTVLAKKRIALSRLGIAACLLLVVAGFIHYDLYYFWLADHLTRVGQQQMLTLADGSMLYLNTDSAIKLDFNTNRRRIELLKGEAEFVVAHDAARPFVVSVGSQTVTALGTDFSVRESEDGLIVSVFENAVQVKRDEESLAVVEQGQNLRVPEHIAQLDIRPIEIEEARAWRDGKLIFTAKPLREVIAEINRYRRGEILLLATDSAERTVSGVFALSRLDDSIAVIADTLKLKSMQLKGLVTVLY